MTSLAPQRGEAIEQVLDVARGWPDEPIVAGEISNQQHGDRVSLQGVVELRAAGVNEFERDGNVWLAVDPDAPPALAGRRLPARGGT